MTDKQRKNMKKKRNSEPSSGPDTNSTCVRDMSNYYENLYTPCKNVWNKTEWFSAVVHKSTWTIQWILC